MDRDYINENLLIERHLQGKLSEREQEALEEQIMMSEDLLNDAEAAELLQRGIQDVHTVERSRARSPEKQAHWLASLFYSPQYAMAASFLLVVSFGISGLLYQRGGESPMNQEVTALSTQIVPVISVRGIPGGDPINTLFLGAAEQQFVLMLDPGLDAYSSFRATVYRKEAAGEQSKVWQVDGMTPGYEDMLAFGLPGSVLAPGDFEIRLEGWRDEWLPGHAFDAVDSVTFRVLAERR